MGCMMTGLFAYGPSAMTRPMGTCGVGVLVCVTVVVVRAWVDRANVAVVVAGLTMTVVTATVTNQFKFFGSRWVPGRVVVVVVVVVLPPWTNKRVSTTKI